MLALLFSVALDNNSMRSGNFLNFIRDEIIPNIVERNIGAKIAIGAIQSSLVARFNCAFVDSKNAENSDKQIIHLLYLS